MLFKNVQSKFVILIPYMQTLYCMKAMTNLFLWGHLLPKSETPFFYLHVVKQRSEFFQNNSNAGSPFLCLHVTALG